VAALAVCIPGMAYVTSLVPEVLAYPWYALCSWLIVRALASKRKLDSALAGLACIGALLVRYPQFATVPAAWGIAAAVLWFTGVRGRAWRAGRSRGDLIGAAVLIAGGLILFNRVFLQHIEIWQVSTQYWKGRIVDLGLSAALAFTVGMGVLPVIGGLASLHLPERRGDPVYRAFAAYAGTTFFCVWLYTGVKAAYLSTVFSTLTEERNLIYLSPLVLIGSALVLQSRRIDWRIVAAATAFVIYVIYEQPYQLLYPYFEAPGFAILTIPTRHWSWTIETLQLVLLGVTVLSLVALAFRQRRAVAVTAAVFCAAWMLTSEVSTTIGFDDLATNKFRPYVPAQLDWIDATTGGQPVTYLGQEIKDPNGLLLTEFWNRSVQRVYSMDGTAPGPGPTNAPEIVSAHGLLANMPDFDWVVADNGVKLQAEAVRTEVLQSGNQMTLYRRHGPWKLLDVAQQLYSDGWVPDWSSYTYFKPGQRGTLEVTLSRQGCNGCGAPTGHARLVVGTVLVSKSKGLLIGHVQARYRRLVRNGSIQTLRIPVARTPVRVELHINTFHTGSDPRDLGAQVNFKFVPAKG